MPHAEKLKRIYEVRKQIGYIHTIANKLQAELEELLTDDEIDQAVQKKAQEMIPVVPRAEDEG